MKTFKTLVFLALLLLGFTQCKKEIVPESNKGTFCWSCVITTEPGNWNVSRTVRKCDMTYDEIEKFSQSIRSSGLYCACSQLGGSFDIH
jgi:hypothetical protein